MRAGAVLGILALAAGCGRPYHQRLLPTPESPRLAAGMGYLRAGFARVDFTPPPGVGLAGNAPEGLRSDGWRLHLFARAMVLEDPSGERLAFVIADLVHVSPNLHREVADLVVDETGIGADRLVISATHTHSGPGHFYAEASYNDQSSRVTGYDPSVERLLVIRMAEAVRLAAGRLRHAWAGWSIDSLTGVSRNRSVTAYCNNDPANLPEPCPPSLIPGHAGPASVADSARVAGRFVSHQLAVLRVDTLPPRAGDRPAALFSVFAIHGTGNPNATTLLDGDIPGLVMARLEGWLGGGGPGAVAMLLNGAEGDVSPDVDFATRCPRPTLGPVGPVNPVRGQPIRYDYLRGPAREREDCLRKARREVERLAAIIADTIRTRVESLGPGRLDDRLAIRRAFTTVWLPGDSLLCPTPVAGTAAIGGAEDAQTRVLRWEPFAPFVHLRLYEGGQAADPPHGCQAEKHRVTSLQSLFVGEHGFPEMAQLTVARIGPVGVATVPAEVTTMVGRSMRQAVAAGLGMPGGEGRVVVVGLANGFLQYVNTAAEYRVQSYEGGSNLYGPGTAAGLTRRLGALAATIAGPAPSPAAPVAPIVAYPGEPQDIMPDSVGERSTIGDRRLHVQCRRGAVRARWRDLPPGRLPPWTGDTMVTFRAASGVEASDGDPTVAIRVRGRHHDGSYAWEAEWLPGQVVSDVRVTLPGGRGRAVAEASLPAACGAVPRPRGPGSD